MATTCAAPARRAHEGGAPPPGRAPPLGRAPPPPPVRRSAQDLDESCTPLISPNNSRDERTYDPCGLKAASMFDDVVEIRRVINGSIEVPVKTSKDITFDFETSYMTWGNDSGRPWLFGQDDTGFGGDGRALHEAADVAAADVADGPTRVDFAVWMRSSPLSPVRKPLLRIEEDLLAGETYALFIRNRYNVDWFKGCKSLRLTPWGKLGSDSGALVLALSLLCAMSFVLALTILFSIGHSSQPGRVEELLHELLNLDRRENEARSQRNKSMMLTEQPQSLRSPSTRSTVSFATDVSARDSAPPAPNPRQQTSACSSANSQSSEASQVLTPASLTPASSSKRLIKADAPAASAKADASAASAPNPGMRKIETEPAAVFDRHRAREREILSRYASNRGEGVRSRSR